jgi:hypothetical protein
MNLGQDGSQVLLGPVRSDPGSLLGGEENDPVSGRDSTFQPW